MKVCTDRCESRDAIFAEQTEALRAAVTRHKLGGLGRPLHAVVIDALDRALATPAPHEHRWTFGGLRYRHDTWPVPGGSAKYRYYTDWFYCDGCSAEEHRNERVIGTSYEPVIGEALPR